MHTYIKHIKKGIYLAVNSFFTKLQIALTTGFCFDRSNDTRQRIDNTNR